MQVEFRGGHLNGETKTLPSPPPSYFRTIVEYRGEKREVTYIRTCIHYKTYLGLEKKFIYYPRTVLDAVGGPTKLRKQPV